MRFPRPALFVALLALSVISSALKVDMPVGVGSSCISLSYIVDFTALLLLGPQPTMLIAMASAWAQCTFRMKERNPPHRTLFSMACLVLTVLRRGRAYYVARWHVRGTGTTPLQPLLGAVMTYFLVNSVTVATAFALASRRDRSSASGTTTSCGASRATWSADWRPALTVELIQRAGHWQTPLAFIPLCLTYRTYEIYLGRIADEQRRVAEWSQLHRESTEVLARAIQAKDGAWDQSRRAGAVLRGERWRAALQLSELDTQAVETAALLHDIGKLAVPEHILSKPGPLTADERKKMQIHAQVGAEIVERGPVPVPGRATDPQPSRALGRYRISDGPERRADSDRRASPGGGRLLRCGDVRSAVSARGVAGGGARGSSSRTPATAFDPAIVEAFRGACLPLLSRRRTSRSRARGIRSSGTPSDRTRSMPVGGTDRCRCLRGDRARQPGELHALRDRAGDGPEHEPVQRR